MHSVNPGTQLISHSLDSQLAFPSFACLAAASGYQGCNDSMMNPASPSTAATLAAVAAVSSGFPYPTKDSRWLTLEVCRQFQRKLCSRTENECKFAHPPSQVDIQNGRVICCYDSIKGKCQRRDPACKYFHPPQHLREQLLQNGRNNLIMKSMQFQLMQQQQQHQLLAQGAMLPLGRSSVSSPPAPNSVRQCVTSCSPVSSVRSITSTGNLIYPSPQQLNFPSHGIINAFSLLGIQLAPYLNAIAASSLNQLTSSPAMNVAQNSPVTFSSGNLPPLSLGVFSALPIPTMASKRVAIADTKSGMPMFQTDQTLSCAALNSLSIAPDSNNSNRVFTICSPNTGTEGSQQLMDESALKIFTFDSNENGTSVGASVANVNSEENWQQPAIFYPEHYGEIPQYGYL